MDLKIMRAKVDLLRHILALLEALLLKGEVCDLGPLRSGRGELRWSAGWLQQDASIMSARRRSTEHAHIIGEFAESTQASE